MECEGNAQFKCWQCSGPLCDTHARRAGNAGMVYCNMTHAPTEDEVATYERAIELVRQLRLWRVVRLLLSLLLLVMRRENKLQRVVKPLVMMMM